jgi:proteasome alpha subunit
LPFYVSPEQLTKDRSEFARAGVAKGRAVIVLATTEGILLVTENPSRSLHKIAEVYDRIAFAGVGKYNEFEMLRRAGVRYADLRGYSYDRVDVDARGLAEAYGETLGTVFTMQPKPYEVEIAVAEVGATPAEDRIFRVGFDGSLWETGRLVVIGGKAVELQAELVAQLGLGSRSTPDDAEPPGEAGTAPTLRAGLAAAVAVLTGGEAGAAGAMGAHRARGPASEVGVSGGQAHRADRAAARKPGKPKSEAAAVAPLPEATDRLAGLECALLDRSAPRRTFRRLTPAMIATLAAT